MPAPSDALLARIVSAIDSLPEALVVWDAQDRLMLWNDQYLRLCPRVAHLMKEGVDFESVVRESVRLGQFTIEGDAEAWIQSRLEFHRRCEGYFEQQLDTGQWVRMSERRTPWGGVISIRSDLTSLKARERELRAAKEQADAATAAKSHFLAVISHELRTPMNSVLGLAQTLATGSLTQRQESYVGTIISSARALVGLLDDMLDISRIEQGRLDIHTQAVPLRATLDEVVHLFEAKAREKGLALRVRVADRIPDAVLADPLRLRQILINFVNNALKFTSQGHVELGAQALPGGQMRIEVRDSGSGLSVQQQAQLFQPFSRVATSGTHQLEGAGLGLAICKQLAEAMGGCVGVASAKGRGSTFWLALRAATPIPAAPAAVALPAAASSLCVLVVDDDAVNGLVARALLDQLGHRSTVRRSGRTALRLLENKPYDAVLLDIMMPGENGIAVAQRIRALAGERGRIPIFATTARLMPDSVESYRQAGIDGVLPKPIILDQLQRAMSSVVARREVPLVRIRADLGLRRYRQIVAQSRRTFADAAAQLQRSRTEAGVSHTLPALLHRLGPTATLLGFVALAQEVGAVQDAAARAPQPEALQTHRLQSLLEAAVRHLDQKAIEQTPSAFPALQATVPRAARLH